MYGIPMMTSLLWTVVIVGQLQELQEIDKVIQQ